MARTYIIYCEPCGFKKMVEDPLNVGLSAYPTSPVPGRIPMLDEKGKTETFPDIKLMPKFKCPNCGRTVTLKKFNVPKGKPVDERTDSDF